MNRIYRSIWNQATGAYSAVSEHVNSAGKRTMPGAGGAVAQFALKALAASMLLGFGTLALAGPLGGVVVGGTATINGAPGAMVIDQASQNAIINWASFNIGKSESVTFRQPNSNAVALNRVLGADGTTIMGNLSANGKVFLVNPNGVMFGKGASVNVGGLVASTLDIANADFMAGNYQFAGHGGTVLNQGAISAPGGYVALLGAHVSNEGTIAARLGSVVLAAGKGITLDVAGDGLLNVTVNQGAVNALVENGGMLHADGGRVLMSAQAAGNLLKTVVNNTGVIEARTIDTRGGTIKLLGDMQTGTVNAGGTLDASAPAGGNGGFIDTSAAHVNIAEGIHVTAQAAAGLTGTWLIDPVDFTIAASGGNMTGTVLSDSLKAADVQIQSTSGSGGTAGNINVNDVVGWSANKLTLTAQNNINVNVPMHGTGTASLALEYGQANVASGNASVYNVNAAIDLPSGNSFSTKLGSDGAVAAYTVINRLGDATSSTGTDLQGMRGDLTRHYALGSNIDASATATWNSGAGFTPVGNTPAGFTGKLDGLGHDITGLTIASSDLSVGLFDLIGVGGVARNVNILGASFNIAGSGSGSGWGFNYGAAGFLAGRNKGAISNVRVSGGLTIQGSTSGGGLVGFNEGAIANSTSAATVSGHTTIGGLVGQASFPSAITASSASGAVSGEYYLGGLVGANDGAVANSYATGAVSGSSSDSYWVGGLVGLNLGTAGYVSNSYATGNVKGNQSTGGVVGTNEGVVVNVYASGTVTGGSLSGGVVGSNTGMVMNGYFNTTANPSPVVGIGSGTVSGATGLTNAQMTNPTNFTGFTFTATPGLAGNNWVTIGSSGAVNFTSGTLPMLSAEHTTAINSVHQLQLISLDRSAAYSLGSSFSAASTSGGDVWGAGGFVPIGTSSASARFIGSLDGAGHIISDLSIARAAYAGLFNTVGATGTIANLGLAGGTIRGTGNVGALAGANYGTISGSFATSSVTASATRVGGLVGWNFGTIRDSYASGAVMGGTQAGGLVGLNAGSVTSSYANGPVSGFTLGGLIGANSGTVTGSYWDQTTSGQATSMGGTGLTTAQLKTLANYNSATTANGSVNPAWNLATMWVLYDGQSAPLLRSFMTPLTITVANSTKVYDGAASGAGGSVTYSRPVDSNLLYGTTVVSGVNNAAVNVGTYAVTGGGQYSTSQTGYAITYVAGDLTITPRQLSLSGVAAGSKVYDGTTSAVLSGGTLSNVIAADAGNVNIDLASLVGTYASKNVGSGILVSATGSLAGSASANYTLAPLTGVTGAITAKALTVSGLSVLARQYDGTTAATVTGGTLSGIVGGETLGMAASSGTYLDANAGTGKALTVTPGALIDGTGLASNYALAAPTGVTGTITAKALTVTGAAGVTRVYDGTTDVTVTGGVLNGLVGTETLGLSGLAGVFADKNAGTGKSVTVSGATLSNGANGGLAGNYTVANPTGLAANVAKATISSVSAMQANSKVYDGNTTATVDTAGATFNGIVNGDSLTASATGATFDTKNAGTGKTVAVTGIALGGTDAANYNLATTTGNATGSITPKTVTIVGMSAVNKVYSGTTQASVSGGAISGTIGSETLGATGLVATFSDKNVGTGKTVTAVGTTLVNGNNGGLAANYMIVSPITFTANITPKALTVSGMTAATKTYDGLLSATLAGGALNGLVPGETLVFLSGSGVFASKNAGANQAVTVTGTTLANGTGLASNYTVTNPVTVTGTITRKTLTVAGSTAASKTYDGLVTASIAGGTLDGLVGLETVSLTGLNGVFADQNAGTNKTVTVTGGTLANGANGGLAGNYVVGASGGLTADIARKALTVTGVSAANRVYDGGTAATLAGGALSGLVGSETLVLSGLAGTFGDKHVGAGKTVTIGGAALADGSGLASNYTVGNPASVTAAITQASITAVTGLTATAKVYDGVTGGSVVASNGAFTGMVAGDTLSASGAAVFADKNVGAGKMVAVSGITLGGLDAGNYSLASGTGSGTGAITAKNLTIVGMTAVNKVYNGTTQASLSGGALSGLVGAETLGVTGLVATFADKNAGTGKAVTATGSTLVNGGNGGLAANYTITNPTGLAASVTPKTLTVTGMTASTKVYDGALAVTLAGGALSGLVAGETLAFTGGTGAFTDKNAGVNKGVTVTGSAIADGTGLASNYTVVNPGTITGTITQKALTLGGVAASDKVYDGTTAASVSGGVLDGLVGAETLGVTGLAATFDDQHAGSGKTVTATGATLVNGGNGGLASNYAVSNPTGLTARVTQKALTIVGMAAVNKTYDGTTVASLTGGSLNGLVGAETLGVSGLAAAFDDKNAGVGKTVTATGATLVNGVNGGLASNYVVSNPTGLAASITQKALTVTGAVAGDKVYDGTTAAQVSGGTLTGLVGAETLGITGQTGVFSDKNAASGKAVTVSGTTLVDGVDGLASNYVVSNPTGLAASITRKALTVTGTVAAGKVYDGTTSAVVSGSVLSGLVGAETLGITGQAAVFSDKNAASGKAVTVTGTTLVDSATGLARNYTVSNPTGLTATINRAAITGVTGIQAADKVYDGTTSATVNTVSAAFTGIVAGDRLALTGGTGAFSDRNAAANKTVTVSGLALAGADAGNYVFGGMASTLATIAQAALVVKVDNAVKDQGRVNPAFTASYTGLVGGDTLAASVTGDLVYATGATAASGAATYLVAASGQASTNYALSYTPGVLTVNPTETLQNAISSAVASAAVMPAQGTMVATDAANAATPLPQQVAGSGRGKDKPAVRQLGNAVVEAVPGLNLVVVNRGLLLPTELAAAPGGSD